MVAAYVRVSTEDQAREGFSLEGQPRSGGVATDRMTRGRGEGETERGALVEQD